MPPQALPSHRTGDRPPYVSKRNGQCLPCALIHSSRQRGAYAVCMFSGTRQKLGPVTALNVAPNRNSQCLSCALIHSTRQIGSSPCADTGIQGECSLRHVPHFCRGPVGRHMAYKLFAVCLDKKHTANFHFSVVSLIYADDRSILGEEIRTEALGMSLRQRCLHCK